MKTLAILGASGHGKVVADAALCSGWTNIIFFDDRWPELQEVGLWRVVGHTESLLNIAPHYDAVIVAIGSNVTRLMKVNSLMQADIPLATIIHPRAVVSAQAKIGLGSVVFAGAVINIDCHIGMACIINTGATVDHDCKLGDGVHVSPGAHLGGGVLIGDLSWVGIGSSVRQCIKIGAGVVVGAGAAVVKDIEDNCTALGVPARVVSKKRD